mmetsp:Transcript_8240/g.22700  ORF Transcript_8240/g.22700 Transcript_8240/m.22700 type:complete len:291 (+) Transcript_8240:470-1342(+)
MMTGAVAAASRPASSAVAPTSLYWTLYWTPLGLGSHRPLVLGSNRRRGIVPSSCRIKDCLDAAGRQALYLAQVTWGAPMQRSAGLILALDLDHPHGHGLLVGPIVITPGHVLLGCMLDEGNILLKDIVPQPVAKVDAGVVGHKRVSKIRRGLWRLVRGLPIISRLHVVAGVVIGIIVVIATTVVAAIALSPRERRSTKVRHFGVGCAEHGCDDGGHAISPGLTRRLICVTAEGTRLICAAEHACLARVEGVGENPLPEIGLPVHKVGELYVVVDPRLDEKVLEDPRESGT